MIGSMPTTTKWNSWCDWRFADISETNILASFKTPVTCFLSANAWGLKGHLPGGKHSWVATFNGYSWKTYEISDLETVELQGGNILYAVYPNTELKQLIVSDRSPSTKWFNNMPRIDYIHSYIDLKLDDYPLNSDVNLTSNNCNTLTSYIAWKYGIPYNNRYIGSKNKKFWHLQADK